VVYLREDDVLVEMAAHGLKNLGDRRVADRIEIPVGRGIVGTVAATGVPEIVDDTGKDPRYIPDRFLGKSELTVPVLYKGRVIAVFDSESSEAGAFTRADAEFLQAAANIASSRLASAVAERELRSAKERVELLLCQGPTIVYTARSSGDLRATFISPNLLEQMGHTPEDFTGTASFWTDQIHPDDVEGVRSELTALFESGRCVQEYRLRHADGSYRWIRDEVRVVEDDLGEPLELVGSWLDISERRIDEENRPA
jgi:PAS domain S-box-containing protein